MQLMIQLSRFILTCSSGSRIYMEGERFAKVRQVSVNSSSVTKVCLL